VTVCFCSTLGLPLAENIEAMEVELITEGNMLFAGWEVCIVKNCDQGLQV